MLDLARPFPSATCPGDIYKENHCCLRLVKWKSDEDFDVTLHVTTVTFICPLTELT